ncbi:MAG: uroporphyrinogen decarboxylase family protein [Candidatus Omnitrophota bacterium]
MKLEPNFERLRRTLFCQEPDRVPLAELLMDREMKDAFLGKPVRDTKTDVEFWKAAGYDYICIFPAKEMFEQSLPTNISYTQTAVGEGKFERKWAEGNRGVIACLKEFEEFPWPDSTNANYKLVEETKSHLPEGMGLICSVGGLWEYVWQLMGFESFSMALADNPELVEKMFHRVREIVYEIFTNLMDFDGIDAMWFCDDIAYTEGLMISPDILRKYLFPWYKKMAKICHDRGLPVLYHSDGNLWQVMGDIIDAGINAIHPIEPKAMDIGKLKKEVGDRLCLIGNIDLGYTLTRGTPEEVEEEVRQRIKDIAPGGGYCVGSSNTVTNYVPLENYQAMIEATLKYGSYPK